MSSISIQTLGAGSEVGRSCFLVTIDDTTILIDAGVHMNPVNKEDRVPTITPETMISAVIVTHYHMDHVGALPYLTEVSRSISEDTEIFMTSPTKTLSPLVCLDYSRGPNEDLYVPNHVYSCFRSSRIKIIGCGEEVMLRLNAEFKFNVVYAGHVIGGVMLILRYRGKTVVYTGDFSVTEHDVLLDPIRIPPKLIPKAGCDVVISESTHATTVDPKKTATTESLVCDRIQNIIARGGRVLIPVFAVGRTQEIASMLRRRLGNGIPLFTTSPSGHRASAVMSVFHRQWMKPGSIPPDLNITLLGEKDDFPANAVVFASPSMIEGGSSLRLFGQICSDPKSLVLLTGYCNRGTVGNSVIFFSSRRDVRDRSVSIMNTKREVNCECMYVPLTNHTDGEGIVKVLRQLRPRSGLVLVHGQRDKIERFSERIRNEAIIDPRCEIVIPMNYDTSVFNPSIPITTTTRNEMLIIVKRRIPVSTRFTIRSLEEDVRALLPYCEISGIDSELFIRDGRCSLTLWLDDSDLVLKCNSDRRMGARWIRANPLADCVSRVLVLKTYLACTGICDDTFSVSECSD